MGMLKILRPCLLTLFLPFLSSHSQVSKLPQKNIGSVISASSKDDEDYLYYWDKQSFYQSGKYRPLTAEYLDKLSRPKHNKKRQELEDTFGLDLKSLRKIVTEKGVTRQSLLMLQLSMERFSKILDQVPHTGMASQNFCVLGIGTSNPSDVTGFLKVATGAKLGEDIYSLDEDIKNKLEQIGGEDTTKSILKDPEGFHESLWALFDKHRRQLVSVDSDEDQNFPVPYFKDVVENLLKDFELRNSIGLPEELISIHGQRLEKIIQELRSYSYLNHFPYKKTIMAIAQYTYILSCIFDGHKGLDYFVEGVKKNGKVCDPEKFDSYWNEEIARRIKVEGKSSNFHFPTFAPLTIQDFNRIRDSGIRLLGVAPIKTMNFDAGEDSPFGFFIHDLLHSGEMRNGEKVVASMKSAKTDVSEMRPIWKRTRENLNDYLDKNFGKPFQREIHELILFSLTHENLTELRPPSIPFDKEQLLLSLKQLANKNHNSKDASAKDSPSILAKTLSFRLLNEGDLALALESPENKELLQTLKSAFIKGKEDYDKEKGNVWLQRIKQYGAYNSSVFDHLLKNAEKILGNDPTAEDLKRKLRDLQTILDQGIDEVIKGLSSE